MPLINVDSKKLRKAFVDLYYQVYATHAHNRDNFNHSAINFLERKDSFSRECFIQPLLVSDGNRFTARAVFLHHPRLEALQLAFFEALPGQTPAVDALLRHARDLAYKRKLSKVVIGLNGHLTYGVGFLKNGHDLPAVFDGAYTPGYYLDYFNKRGFTEHTLSTYYAESALFKPSAALCGKAYQGVTYRTIRFDRLRQEMDILGELFNTTLAATRFYFPKQTRSSYEMIKGIRPLLKPDHIILALKDGREVGFVIWHPDFNEVLPDNRRIHPLLFFLQCKLSGKRIKGFTINTIGVLPEYENSGVSLGLLAEVFKRVRHRYPGGETGFVWDDNLKSSLFCKALCRRRLRRYAVYEWALPPAMGEGS